MCVVNIHPFRHVYCRYYHQDMRNREFIYKKWAINQYRELPVNYHLKPSHRALPDNELFKCSNIIRMWAVWIVGHLECRPYVGVNESLHWWANMWRDVHWCMIWSLWRHNLCSTGPMWAKSIGHRWSPLSMGQKEIALMIFYSMHWSNCWRNSRFADECWRHAAHETSF